MTIRVEEWVFDSKFILEFYYQLKNKINYNVSSLIFKYLELENFLKLILSIVPDLNVS